MSCSSTTFYELKIKCFGARVLQVVIMENIAIKILHICLIQYFTTDVNKMKKKE